MNVTLGKVPVVRFFICPIIQELICGGKMGFKKNTLHLIILGILSAGIFVSHILYVAKSRQYPQWDEHNYLSLAIKYYDILQTPSLDIYRRLLSVTGYLQPLYSLIVSIPLLMFGMSHTYTIALLLNGLLFVAVIL